MRQVKQVYLIDLDPPVTVHEEPFGPSVKEFALLTPNGKVLHYFIDQKELQTYGFSSEE